MGIAFLMDEQGKQELRTQFVELRAWAIGKPAKKKARGLSVSRLKEYYEQVFVNGSDLYGSGLPE